MNNAIQKIHEVREARLRATSLSTMNFVLVLCIIFWIRSIQWALYGRVLSLSVCSLLVIISILVLRRGGTRTLAAILGIIGSCIAVGYASYSSGGLGNPATGWLVLLPLVGALVGGIQGGIFAFIFSLATGSGLFYHFVRKTLPFRAGMKARTP